MQQSIRAALCAFVALWAGSALAESGPINIHLEPGVAINFQPKTRNDTVGSTFGFKLDVPMPFYKKVAAQAHGQIYGFPRTATVAQAFGAGLGVRYRILDDDRGYWIDFDDDPNTGNFFGGLWADANIGLYDAPGRTLGFDVGVGAETSFIDGLQFGPFLKYAHLSNENMLLAGLSLSIGLAGTEVRDPDPDKDGILDPTDKCPTFAEDKDGFQDEDGCPDRDNDQDTVVDEKDACVMVPEDADGVEDSDGCPEDNDKDGFADADDKCVNDPEDKDGFEDNDGCPDLDNDKDGIADATDQCVNDPEDKDSFKDEDGCPDPDNDNDRIADVTDQCVNEPETYDGRDDEDGCPEADTQVFVEKERIVIKDKVFFAFNKATILPKSFPLLDKVASVLNRFTNVKKIEVGGHTDDVGTDAYNDKLSQQRAEAVMNYLSKQGKVDKSRLSAKGYGKTKPLVEGTDEAAREKNRRVEFVILESE